MDDTEEKTKWLNVIVEECQLERMKSLLPANNKTLTDMGTSLARVFLT